MVFWCHPGTTKPRDHVSRRFEIAGYGKDEVEKRSAHGLTPSRFTVPRPTGLVAQRIDRIVMLLQKRRHREVSCFPAMTNARRT